MKQALKRGTIFQAIVGVPGPDVETGIVVECVRPGHHRVMRVNYMDGSIYEAETSSFLNPGILYPGQAGSGEVERLRKALDKESGE